MPPRKIERGEREEEAPESERGGGEQSEAGEAPDADDVFEAGQDTKVEGPFEYDEEEPNLVAAFKTHPEGQQALKRLAGKALDDFDDAWKATEKVRTNMAEIWKLFSGVLDPKPPPFDKMSNVHVPILMENTIRMAHRQSYELFGNWTNVFGVTPIGPDDERTAKLLSLHGNWQIRKRIKDFKRQIGHRGLLIFDLFGDVTCHSYWDPQRKQNRHEILTANEFVCANAHISTMPDYSDVSWVAKIIYMDAHELRGMDGAWEDVATTLKSLPPEWDDAEITRELRDMVDKSIGFDSTAYRKGQYRLIQYEGWLNLPNQAKDRYCKIIVDYGTKTVLSLGIHERVDPYEKRRYEFELQELQRYQQTVQAMQQYQQELEQTRLAILQHGHEMPADSDAPTQAILMARALEEQPPPPEPRMPAWMQGDPNAQPVPPESAPIRMFAHGVNIEPIQGILGLGTGSIHAAQNKAANIAMSMFVDQGTLGNFKNFIVKGDLRLPEKFSVEPGKFHKIDGATDLMKDIMPLDFGEANPQLIQLVEMLVRFGNTVSNTPEVLSGESGKSGETAQGISARIEQATKMLSVPTGKYADFVTVILQNNAALNAVFLPDVEWFSVLNHDPAIGPIGQAQFNVGRELYDRPYDVEISADLKFTSTAQRIQEADALVQLPQAVQELAGNFAFKHATISKSLEARNRFDLIALLGAAPQAPQMFGVPTSPPAPPPGAVAPAPPGAGAPAPGGPQQQKPPGKPPQPQRPPQPQPANGNGQQQQGAA